MKLYVETMDAVVVDVDATGRGERGKSGEQRRLAHAGRAMHERHDRPPIAEA